MKKISGIVKGAMSYLKRPFILKFEESKPPPPNWRIWVRHRVKEQFPSHLLDFL